MKVAFLSPSISRTGGGIFEIAKSLAISLSNRADTEVDVFGVKDEFTTIDASSWNPVSVVSCDPWGPRAFGYSPRLREAVLGCSADVAHLHALWTYMSILAQEWSRKRDRPYVTTLNGMLDPWALRNSALKKRIARLAYESRGLGRAGCIQVNSEAELAAARSFGLCNPVCIVANGVEMPDLTAPIPSDRGHPMEALKREGRKVLLYLGRMHQKKNLLNLIQALSIIGDLGEEWVLVIAGWSQRGYEAELRKRVEILSVTHQVVFLEPQYGVAKDILLRRADAFVLPSYSEGLPMAVLEAWAYAKPVLMTPQCNLGVGYEYGAAIRIDPDARSIAEGLRLLFAMSDTESPQAR